jgi:ubiquinone/menaquinone biosynthesis C-methylase UbiE
MIDFIKIKNFFAGKIFNFTKKYSRKNLYNNIENALKDHSKNKDNILNIGAGGEVKRILLKNRIVFKELDIDKKRNPDYVGDIMNMNIFDDNTFDVIVCAEVLEHVKNPFVAVNEIMRVLKPGGVLIGSTPFIFPIHDEPNDYFRYTRYGILNLFNNFDLLNIVERNSYIESVYVVMLRLNNIGTRKQKIVGLFLLPIFLMLLPLFKMLSFLVVNSQATTGYFFVFKKKDK